MSVPGFLKTTLSGLGYMLTAVLLLAFCTSHPAGDENNSAARDDSVRRMNDSVKQERKLNEIARFLAGTRNDSDSLYSREASSETWKTYAKESDTNWSRFFRRKFNPVHRWEQKEIPASMDSVKTLFYPFSGPDFIFANAFFPWADNYILFGLEPPGSIPDPSSWSDKNLKSSLALINKSIDYITSIGFFRTNDMKVELESASVNGVTPLLMLFLVRSGHRITEIIPGELDTTGEFRPVKNFSNDTSEASYGKAVEIRFTEIATGRKKSMLYFSADISDKGLKKNAGCRNFLRKIPSNCMTLIKSASYLMHLSSFTGIRTTILAKSLLILQDDSGIPYRLFKSRNWDIRLYGSYTQTISLFKNKYQEDLKEAYEADEKPGTLPFRIGYNFKFNETNLLMAVRKSSSR